MFSRTIIRSVLAALVTAAVLVPAAQADDWFADRDIGLDPAIVTALHARTEAAQAPIPLDPAIAAAMRRRGIEYRTAAGSAVDPDAIPLDPAIRTAVARHSATTATRPDDRAEARGVGSLPQPAPVEDGGGGFEWSRFGLGSAVALLLVGLASMLVLRHGRTRVSSV